MNELHDGRQTILARLAAAVSTISPIPAETTAPLRPSYQPADYLPALSRSFDRLQVTWEIAENSVVARLTLVIRLQDEGIKQVLAWSAAQLPIVGVLEALEVLGIEVITPALYLPDVRLRPQDVEQRRRQLLALETVPVGLTGADLACAANGALLLNSGPGRPLLVSQLPRRHIVLLPASRIIPELADWPTAQPGPVTLATWITGPSRTLDIEMTPAYGLHGPGKLHVIIVQGI
ncbi:MAG: lactate utilization protein [Caldilineales bacterium]